VSGAKEKAMTEPISKKKQRTHTYVEGLRKRIRASIQHNLALREELTQLKSALQDIARNGDAGGTACAELASEALAANATDWDAHWKETWARVKAEPETPYAPPAKADEPATKEVVQ
jgi:hypothetical protein